jgi:hypothetical protein
MDLAVNVVVNAVIEDKERKIAGPAVEIAFAGVEEDEQVGLMSAAHLARGPEAAARANGVVVGVSSVVVVPDPGGASRLYITLDIGSKTGSIPGRIGQLRAVNGGFIPGSRFEIENMSPTECSASIEIKDGAGAEILSRFANGTLEAVIFQAGR